MAYIVNDFTDSLGMKIVGAMKHQVIKEITPIGAMQHGVEIIYPNFFRAKMDPTAQLPTYRLTRGMMIQLLEGILLELYKRHAEKYCNASDADAKQRDQDNQARIETVRSALLEKFVEALEKKLDGNLRETDDLKLEISLIFFKDFWLAGPCVSGKFFDNEEPNISKHNFNITMFPAARA